MLIVFKYVIYTYVNDANNKQHWIINVNDVHHRGQKYWNTSKLHIVLHTSQDHSL